MFKTDPSAAKSWYEYSRNRFIDAPELQQHIDVDVAVIGGGITGCSTALHLAKKGLTVAVLEARYVGWGASGRSGGQIINGYSCELEVLEQQLGADMGRRFWQHSLRSVDYTRQLISDYNIDCDLTMGYLHLGVKQSQSDELISWAESLSNNYGYNDMQVMSREEIESVMQTECYSGGVYDPNSGHLHPLNYTLGLGAAAQSEGVQLFQNTPVLGVVEDKTSKQVNCEAGSVSCEHVVYACNAYLENLLPTIDRKIMPVGTYIVATEPLGEDRARSLISNNAAACNNDFVLDYFRLSTDHRMLFGGRVSYSTLEPLKLANSLRARMLKVYPQLGDVKIEFSWGGYVAITRNRAPDVGTTGDGSWYAHGYSGHGMALSGYMGSLMADAITGQAEAFGEFEQISHRSFPGGRMLRTPVLVAAMSYYRLKDRLRR